MTIPDENEEEEEPSAIEQLVRAKRLQRELRAEMARKLEEKDARRAEKRRLGRDTPYIDSDRLSRVDRGAGTGRMREEANARRREGGTDRPRHGVGGISRELKEEAEVSKPRIQSPKIDRHGSSRIRHDREKVEKRKRRRAADAAQARVDRQKIVVRQMAEDDTRELIDLTLIDD